MSLKKMFERAGQLMAEANAQNFGERMGVPMPGAGIVPERETPEKDKVRAAVALSNKR